jgi:DNA processing protein
MQGYWLAFSKVQGLGPVRLRLLRSHFPTIQAAWEASPSEYKACGLKPGLLENVLAARAQLDPAALHAAVQDKGAWVLTLDDPEYPELLRELSDAPPVLYGRGALLPHDRRALGVVGTRRASVYGKEMTHQLVEGLVMQGVTIISGLAQGVDTIAHQSALKAGGRTLAVLGCGVDVVYPPENRALMERIVEEGCILSEFALGTPPYRTNFVARNRVLSGLSLGVLVVEAPAKSGSLITANLAAEQGREVFAVPGNANSPNSVGTNRLIQDGAKLVLNAEDILSELNLSQQQAETRQTAKKLVPSNPTEAKIIAALKNESLHVDEISRLCDLSIQDVNAALLLMELKTIVRQHAPMVYTLNASASMESLNDE